MIKNTYHSPCEINNSQVFGQKPVISTLFWADNIQKYHFQWTFGLLFLNNLVNIKPINTNYTGNFKRHPSSCVSLKTNQKKIRK